MSLASLELVPSSPTRRGASLFLRVGAWSALSLSVVLSAGCSGAPGARSGSGPSTTAAPRPAPAPGASAVSSGSPGPAAPVEEPIYRSGEAADVLIRGGLVIDGSGAERRRADVVVRGDRVVFVGKVDPGVSAKLVVDASGAVVAPGFVDMHAHADPFEPCDQLLAMGVTTMVIGQDGLSNRLIGSFLRRLDKARPKLNVATLIGHATVRSNAGVKATKPADAKQRARIGAIVGEGMRDGAFGLSTALEYEPGRIADKEELAAAAAPVGEHHGVVMSHLRSEDDEAIDASIDELAAQCEATGARAHVSHLKIVLGKGEARARALLDHMDQIRKRGVEITADLYPYDASYTNLAILFPPWARPESDHGVTMKSPREDILAYLRSRVERRNGPGATVFGQHAGRFGGMTLEEAAKSVDKPFEEVLENVGPKATAAYFVLDDAVVERLFADPFVMVGTDGGKNSAHPRGFGAFARILERLVSKKHVVSLEEAVRKMTHLSTETLGIGDERGMVAPGYFADLVVFDPSKIRETATFAHPAAYALGMKAVLVNGVLSFKDERPTRAHAGRALRHRG